MRVCFAHVLMTPPADGKKAPCYNKIIFPIFLISHCFKSGQPEFFPFCLLPHFCCIEFVSVSLDIFQISFEISHPLLSPFFFKKKQKVSFSSHIKYFCQIMIFMLQVELNSQNLKMEKFYVKSTNIMGVCL